MNEDYNKIMIKLSSDVNEANKFLEGIGFVSLDEKIKYLKKEFDIQLISKLDNIDCTENEKKFMDYYSMLSAIISIK